MSQTLPGAQRGPQTPPPQRSRWRWPTTDSKTGAILYAVIGGMIVYVLVDVLPHIHVHITWR
jgi:hypothetical protein